MHGLIQLVQRVRGGQMDFQINTNFTCLFFKPSLAQTLSYAEQSDGYHWVSG